MTRSKQITYWTATLLIAFVFIASGLFKLIGGEKSAEMAKGLGGEGNVMALGILELVIATLWVIKRTGVIGTLLAMAYIGGAMAVHLVTGQPILVPTLIEVLIAVAAFIRFPELTERLLKGKE